ncbi:MAG: 50S ribosomal protein L6 [Phycisphaerae bacterium]|nr:50S ribosomal protein L6 [Phycisphaerae bacterium]MCZ2401345.1 50S ribosomal protein L6 [Phycisphaerae bacterium]NUQ48713.1 50S ribosomal protein L6 [Phycisphaerae bacterium]
MSRIGKKPVVLPAGVKAELSGRTVKVSGPKGHLTWTVPRTIDLALEGGQVVVRRADDLKQTRALHGLSRALIANMVHGVQQGYEIKLEVYGTGYSVKKEGTNLLLNIGFMGRGVGKPAQFVIPIPAGLQVDVEVQAARGENEPAKFTVRGVDKQQVGQFAAEVRKLRKPEPYKGKGVRYAGEHIRRKAGKVFAGGGG